MVYALGSFLSSFHLSIFSLHSHTIPLFSFSLYSHRLHFLWRCHGAFISPSTRLVLLGTACRALWLSDVRIPPGYQGATDRNPDYSFSIYIFSHIFQIIILASPLGDLLSPFSSISVLSITPYSAFYLGIKLYSNYLKNIGYLRHHLSERPIVSSHIYISTRTEARPLNRQLNSYYASLPKLLSNIWQLSRQLLRFS